MTKRNMEWGLPHRKMGNYEGWKLSNRGESREFLSYEKGLNAYDSMTYLHSVTAPRIGGSTVTGTVTGKKVIRIKGNRGKMLQLLQCYSSFITYKNFFFFFFSL